MIHVPLARLSKRQIKTKIKPWLTKDLLDLMKVRDKLYRDLKKCKNSINKDLLFSQFKSCRNRILCLLRTSKKLYYTKFFQENSKNVQKIWKGVREIFTSKTSKADPDITLKIGENISSDPLTVTQTFNDLFSSIADKIRSKVSPIRHNFSNWLKNPIPKSFFLTPATSLEISKIISSMKKNKASGPSSIPVSYTHLRAHETDS